MVSPNSSYCLTNTIDNYSTIGNRYYHNVKGDTVIMRPRLPMRYDFNDMEIVRMTPQEEKLFRQHYRLDDRRKLFHIKRTGLNIFNTLLLYFLYVLLIVVSIMNMMRIINNLHQETDENRVWFRLAFVFSFVVVFMLFLLFCLSLFELYRNMSLPNFFANGVRFKDLGHQRSFILRFIILLLVFIGLIVSMAETLNLFFMNNNPLTLLIFVPSTLSMLFLIQLYIFGTN